MSEGNDESGVHFKGECLCGAVEYEYSGDIGQVLNCHCNECRRWHGAAYRTRTVGEKKSFTWLKGEQYVARYDGQLNAIKTFCKNCGSNLVSLYKENEGLIGLPLGAVNLLNGNIEQLKPVCHIFVEFKAPWHEVEGDIPQYKTLPETGESIHEVK